MEMEYLLVIEKKRVMNNIVLENIYYDGYYLGDFINNYFDRLPSICRINYDKNIKNTEIYLSDYGYYYFDGVIIYNNLWVLMHEVNHLASYDSDKDIAGICDMDDYGIGLDDGVCEYMTMRMFNSDIPTTNYLEVFIVSILIMINDFTECFYTANLDKFILMFPNDKINSLISNLDKYYYVNRDGIGIDEINLLVRDILDDLIDIMILSSSNSSKIKEYCSKFINLYDRYKERYILFNDIELKRYIRSKF